MNARQLCNREHNGHNEVIMDFRVALEIELINKVKVIPSALAQIRHFTNTDSLQLPVPQSYLSGWAWTLRWRPCKRSGAGQGSGLSPCGIPSCPGEPSWCPLMKGSSFCPSTKNMFRIQRNTLLSLYKNKSWITHKQLKESSYILLAFKWSIQKIRSRLLHWK